MPTTETQILTPQPTVAPGQVEQLDGLTQTTVTPAPAQKDERASQHAHLMTEIERTLLDEGYDQVLLIPAVPEHAGLIDVPDDN